MSNTSIIACIILGVAFGLALSMPQKPSAAMTTCLKTQSQATCSHTLGE